MTDYKQIESEIAEKLQAMGFEIESALIQDDYDAFTEKGRSGTNFWSVMVKKGSAKRRIDYTQGAAYREVPRRVNPAATYRGIYRPAYRTSWKPISEVDKPFVKLESDTIKRLSASRPTPPTLSNVLHSLFMDANSVVCSPSFEEWASDLGYDEDSRKAEAAYRACLETYAWLSSVCNFNELCELFQDY